MKVPLAPQESDSKEEGGTLTVHPHIQRHAQDYRSFTPLTHSDPGLNSITQEGTLKSHTSDSCFDFAA